MVIVMGKGQGYMSENGGSFRTLIRRSNLTSFFLVTSVFGVLGVAFWISFGEMGGVVALIWFVQWVFRLGSSSRRRNLANDHSSLTDDDDHSWMKNHGHDGPAFNIDGTPMMGAFDIHGNVYGMTSNNDMFSSSSDSFSSSSDMFSSSSSSNSFD